MVQWPGDNLVEGRHRQKPVVSQLRNLAVYLQPASWPPPNQFAEYATKAD